LGGRDRDSRLRRKHAPVRLPHVPMLALGLPFAPGRRGVSQFRMRSRLTATRFKNARSRFYYCSGLWKLFLRRYTMQVIARLVNFCKNPQQRKAWTSITNITTPHSINGQHPSQQRLAVMRPRQLRRQPPAVRRSCRHPAQSGVRCRPHRMVRSRLARFNSRARILGILCFFS